ncbi:MAG: precorrin-2 C(20)-methyltransferase, partial [Ruminococcus sp.]|nr:precorrin-2 C(20)-methyltransferase [Ruminococcus sp.]
YNSSSIENSLELSGTKVIMKTGRHTHELISLLHRKGLAEHTKAVVNCGFSDERMYTSVDDIPEALGYFTLFIITDMESRNEA